LRAFFCSLSAYHRGKAPLDVLLVLAKQPFEDVREAVWKLVLAVTKHAWVRVGRGRESRSRQKEARTGDWNGRH